jgi:hypothetical protein
MALTANDPIACELSAWQDRLALVSRNLSEINELPALARIKARLRARPDFYAGETASRIGDALAALDDLWRDYLLLNALIDQADSLHKRSGIFHDHESEIRELLHGRSITLPATYVPLAERDLLTNAERADKVTPEELLVAMDVLFALAKDAVLEVDAAETRLKPRLDALLSAARELAARADTRGFYPAEIAAIAAPLESCGAALAGDPLGAGKKLQDGAAGLAQWRARLEAAERERDALEAAFAASTATLEELRQLNQRAQEAHENTSSKIVGQLALPRPTETAVIAHLGAWLDALAASRTRGDWRAAKMGLDKWTASCATHREAEQRTLAASLAALAQRDELRGRLKAIRAKADAHVARGLRLDAQAARLGDEAKHVLYGRPADLKKAAALVGAYETALNLAIRNG